MIRPTAVDDSTPTPFTDTARRFALARANNLTMAQVSAILEAGEFTHPDRSLAADLAALAAHVGATPAQVQAVLDDGAGDSISIT